MPTTSNRCDGCKACLPLRVPVATFKPTRSQRRAVRAHGNLEVRVLRLCFVPEHYQLYLRYQTGRGPELGDLAAVTAMYLAHRKERLEQVRQALRALGDDATARQIVEHVYTDVDEKLWDAAEASVRTQLAYLRGT